MTTLPVREMVLYKHGVGFFRREGKVRGEQATLTFREDEINDVLKSLAAFDKSGGQIVGVHYPTPMDKLARLADSSIQLSDENSLIDLLKSLRGRQVKLDLAEHHVSGRLVGVDVEQEDQINRSLVSIIDEQEGQVRAIPLKSLRGVRIEDEQAGHDLHYFLDTAVGERLRRTVTLRLTPGEHALVVYYVAPSPTWRVSYRLVAETGKDSHKGKALVQGWGLFDNRLDEDLKDVQVTLVAGQPISFIYNLYASRIPQRPTVEDEARIAPGPVAYHGVPSSLLKRIEGPLGKGAAAPAPAARMMAAAVDSFSDRAEELAIDEFQAASSVAAEGQEAGEFFRYEVTTPVTVKRGESALVPIIGSEVEYGKELLYNRAKLPDHPVAALRFRNTSGLTLERGPVTVIEDGEYVGEAVVPFTKADNEVYLPYAVELGVKVTERMQTRREMAGLNLQGRYMAVNEYQVEAATYAIENTTSRDLTVTLEAPIRAGYELFDMPDPDVKTASDYRWRVDIPAHSLVEFERGERRMTQRREEVLRLDYRRLQAFLDGRWIDRATFEMLSGLLDNLAFIENARREQGELGSERTAIYERQEQLRRNLGALQPTGEEGTLRSRVLAQLEATEDRLAAIDGRQAELEEQIAAAEAQIEQTLGLLGGEG